MHSLVAAWNPLFVVLHINTLGEIEFMAQLINTLGEIEFITSYSASLLKEQMVLSGRKESSDFSC